MLLNEDWKEDLPAAYRTLQPAWRPVRALFKELHMRYAVGHYLSFRFFLILPFSFL